MVTTINPDGRRLAIVVTTIGDGSFLTAYAEIVRAWPSPDRVTIYVIGDLNTPPECRNACARIAAEGVRCEYFDAARQNAFLAAFPELAAAIPFRSDNRRNVGYLLAFRDRADVIISIDDDAYPVGGHAFLEHHLSAGTRQRLPSATSSNGWFNLGTMLETQDLEGRRVTAYPRGFPYCRRGSDDSRVETSPGAEPDEVTVGINLGLWLDDPDVDAVTRLALQPRVNTMATPSCALRKGDRTPISSQNVAMCWHAIPASYFVIQDVPVGGWPINRFGDIFGGYFAQMCAESVGHGVRIGEPCIRHARNAHNLFKDLAVELPGYVVLDRMVPMLETPLPPTASYAEAYRMLADRLDNWAVCQRGFLWDDSAARFFAQVAKIMRLWVAACIELAGDENQVTVRSA